MCFKFDMFAVFVPQRENSLNVYFMSIPISHSCFKNSDSVHFALSLSNPETLIDSRMLISITTHCISVCMSFLVKR